MTNFFLCRDPALPPVGKQRQDAKNPDLRGKAFAALEDLSRLSLPQIPEMRV